MNRMCIYPKDVQVLTGRSLRYSRYIIHEIKKKVGKQEYQVVTITEFCRYMGLPEEEVSTRLRELDRYLYAHAS